MEVQAYSSPATDIRVQSTNQTYTCNSGNAYVWNDLILTIQEDGVIGGFLASGNWTWWSGDSGGAWTTNFRVYRNDKLLSEGVTDMYNLVANNAKGGNLFYENLNLLAGTEVFKGETFKLQTYHGNAGTFVTTIDSIICITYKPKGNSFSIPVFE
jgi:hypothetical protein